MTKKILRPIHISGSEVQILDQNVLPWKEHWIMIRTAEQLISAVRSMQIRGAPALGIAGCAAIAISARQAEKKDLNPVLFKRKLENVASKVRKARPTAVNLSWGVMQAMQLVENYGKFNSTLVNRLFTLTAKIADDDLKRNLAIAGSGARLLPRGARVLTHCNAGALATGGYGTALGVLRRAWKTKNLSHVWVSETRPRLQGARLTAWELKHDRIPFTIITDNMAAMLMSEGKVDAVLTGADRITANGDAANKIGTYSLAVLANFHRIPFYVAAPTSTFDFKMRSGKSIPIEQRDIMEVLAPAGTLITRKDIPVINPAFDITPHKLITAIITEYGVVKHPDISKLKIIKRRIIKNEL
jgi:methylthioribose-1-phosphate isomerase